MTDEKNAWIEECLAQLRAGDRSAADRLLLAMWEDLKRLVRILLGGFSRLRSHLDSDDIRQNAALRLMRSLQGVTPATAEDFLRLAKENIRRELGDLVRFYYGRRRGDDEVAQMPAHSPAHVKGNIFDLGNDDDPTSQMSVTWDPAQVAEWTELHERIAALPEEERIAFGLVNYGGKTYDEAASIVGCSGDTIKRRVLRARRTLAKHLGEEVS